jgi:glycosyltransferase involved in cell wall biosynthesis
MAASPPLSVIMAVYNAAPTIRASIESIQAQSFSDWEMFVVDDGSTDGTSELLLDIQTRDDRVRVFRQDKNHGLASALNAAIQRSNSPLIARMDGDDWAFPERFELQVRFLTEHPNVDVLGTAAETISRANEPGPVLRYPERHEQLVRSIFKRNPFIHPSVVFRREFITRMGGYSVELRRAQDYDLWLRAYRSSRFHNLPQVLLRYRTDGVPTLRNVRYSAYVVWRALCRERRQLSGWWCAARPFAGYLRSCLKQSLP